MEKLIIFIKNLWTQTIAPTIESLNRKNKANTDSIVEANEEIKKLQEEYQKVGEKLEKEINKPKK